MMIDRLDMIMIGEFHRSESTERGARRAKLINGEGYTVWYSKVLESSILLFQKQ